jgi:hypothetical protein
MHTFVCVLCSSPPLLYGLCVYESGGVYVSLYNVCDWPFSSSLLCSVCIIIRRWRWWRLLRSIPTGAPINLLSCPTDCLRYVEYTEMSVDRHVYMCVCIWCICMYMYVHTDVGYVHIGRSMHIYSYFLSLSEPLYLILYSPIFLYLDRPTAIWSARTGSSCDGSPSRCHACCSPINSASRWDTEI